MKWTHTHITTLREDPADAEIASHKLLIRASMVRKLASGVYTFLPLGLRVLQKVQSIIREEMDRAGATEILMPALQNKELWETSGRIEAASDVLFQVKDHSRKGWILGPTHEEVVTSLAATEISSYRNLPVNFYQIQTKFRDEIRPRFGLMRCKEFIMKDAYSFDADDASAEKSYLAMYAAYQKIFDRIGLQYKIVEADTGVMGGKFSHEFVVPAEIGECEIVLTDHGNYQASIEKATAKPFPRQNAQPVLPIEEFATPGVKTIAALQEKPYGIAATDQIKTLVYIAENKPVLLMLRGDHQLNEAKLIALLKTNQLRPASEPEIFDLLGAYPGSLGGVRANPKKFSRFILDQALSGQNGMITGANKDGFHLRNVSVERDLASAETADIRTVVAGEKSICDDHPIRIERGIEVGHVFKLGTKYTEAFKATYLDESGKAALMVMGCYGIGVTRTLQAVMEQSHDDKGIIWPDSIAPYLVEIVDLDPADQEVHQVVEKLYGDLSAKGIEVLWDDRDERPGIKFNDADLIGCPWRITVGAKSLKKGGIEIKRRRDKDFQILPLDQWDAWLADLSK